MPPQRLLSSAMTRTVGPPRGSQARGFLFALLAAGLFGCAATPPQPYGTTAPAGLIAQDQDFVIVVAQAGDDLAGLARHYYGDGDKAWVIAQFNGITTLRLGDIVVVPRKLPPAPGIRQHGYQTIPILCYHRLGAGQGRLVVGAAAFERQMSYLARNGYHVVPLARLAAFLRGETPLPAKSVILTLDDGYRSSYEIAYPVLKRFGFPATVFIYSDFVGAAGAVTWAQLREMAASGLIDIQPHSKSHANLVVRLPRENDAQYRERLKLEIATPGEAIREHLATPIATFALPYGDTNDAITEQLRRSGIALALTVTPGGNPFFAHGYMLRRTMIFGEDDMNEFEAKLAVFSAAEDR